jgi:hypothetical protein
MGKPVSIRVVLLGPRQPDQPSCDRLKALLEERSVVQHQQPAASVDADQVVVERGMVDLGKGDAVGDDRMAEKLVGIGRDVGRVQQVIIRQIADRAPVIVGGRNAVPEERRMRPLVD